MKDTVKDMTSALAMSLIATVWTVYQLMKITAVIILAAAVIGVAL